MMPTGRRRGIRMSWAALLARPRPQPWLARCLVAALLPVPSPASAGLAALRTGTNN